jgi:hypothetical protein
MEKAKNEKTFMRYSMGLVGVWGRNRKMKLEVFDLVDQPLDQPLSEEALDKLVEAKLVEIRVKKKERLKVARTKMKEVQYDTYTTFEFCPSDSEFVKHY